MVDILKLHLNLYYMNCQDQEILTLHEHCITEQIQTVSIYQSTYQVLTKIYNSNRSIVTLNKTHIQHPAIFLILNDQYFQWFKSINQFVKMC